MLFLMNVRSGHMTRSAGTIQLQNPDSTEVGLQFCAYVPLSNQKPGDDWVPRCLVVEGVDENNSVLSTSMV